MFINQHRVDESVSSTSSTNTFNEVFKVIAEMNVWCLIHCRFIQVNHSINANWLRQTSYHVVWGILAWIWLCSRLINVTTTNSANKHCWVFVKSPFVQRRQTFFGISSEAIRKKYSLNDANQLIQYHSKWLVSGGGHWITKKKIALSTHRPNFVTNW